MGKYNNNFAFIHALPIFSLWCRHYWFSQSFTWLYTLFCSLLLFPKMLNVSQAASSPAVSLVYAVKNGSVFLNGTAASNLLCQLSAELVGYFLFYPPLIVAERKIQIPYFIKQYYNLYTFNYKCVMLIFVFQPLMWVMGIAASAGRPTPSSPRPFPLAPPG